jgi:hypothetical protein
MSNDFCRCYIGDISLHTLQQIQKESQRLNEWELLAGTDFNYKESYGYREGIWERDELLLQALAKRSVIAETRNPNKVKPSLIWNNALMIADVITLLSLAHARYYSTLAIERSIGPRYSISWGIMARPELSEDSDIVSLSYLGRFIFEALKFIEQNRSWLQETGFFPSIYWYTQAQISYHTAPSVLEMALHWVGMEIIAGAYIDRQKLEIAYKKEKVKRFITDHGYTGSDWNFLEGVIDDWYETRNDLFHEGKQQLSVDVLKIRRQQIRDFISLVLVEMLQKQEETRKKEIAARMQRY